MSENEAILNRATFLKEVVHQVSEDLERLANSRRITVEEMERMRTVSSYFDLVFSNPLFEVCDHHGAYLPGFPGSLPWYVEISDDSGNYFSGITRCYRFTDMGAYIVDVREPGSDDNPDDDPEISPPKHIPTGEVKRLILDNYDFLVEEEIPEDLQDKKLWLIVRDAPQSQAPDSPCI